MKKFFAILLAMCMVVNMLPVFAIAAEAQTANGKIWVNDEENVTFDSIHAAIHAAQEVEAEEAVIHLKGTVQLDSDVKGCRCADGQILVYKKLTILAAEGGATVTLGDAPNADRTVEVRFGGELTLGSDEENAPALVFDGGAKWKGPARWDKVEDSEYQSGVVRTRPLFQVTLTNSSSIPDFIRGTERKTKGAKLVVQKNVTIQNYVNGSSEGIIATHTPGANKDFPGEKVEIVFDGQMRDNASELGGAIFMDGGDLKITANAKLTGNSANVGGAVCAAPEDHERAMPVNVVIDGGELRGNTAFAGGAIAAWPEDIEADDLSCSPVQITMNRGKITNNRAHVWLPGDMISSGINLTCGMGGGGVLLATRKAYFTMNGGEISGNETEEQWLTDGTGDDAKSYLLYPAVGHAISTMGYTYGENQITLNGGSITNNGSGTGSVIEVSQDMLLDKVFLLIMLFSDGGIEEVADLVKLPDEFPMIRRMREAFVDQELPEQYQMAVLIDILSDTSMDEMYDLFFGLVPYVNDGEGGSGFDENNNFWLDFDLDTALESVAALKQSGIGDDRMVLLVNDSAVIGDGQVIGIGADAYVHFAANPDVPVPVQVFPSVTVGTKIISYEKNVNLTDQVDFKVVNDSPKLGVQHIGNAYFITGYYEGEQPPVTRTYTATFKMKDKQLVWKNVSSIVLPTADKLDGWDIPGKFADQLCWSYEEHGATVTVQAGSSFYLKRDTIFTASFANSGNANVTVDFNGGNLDGDTSLTHEYPMGAEVQGDLITGLFENLTPPEGKDGRVIPVGLTEEQVKGIVESDPDVPVYNTASLMQQSYCVNPYIIFENPTTVYVLWAYDKNKNDIPDYLEVEVKIHPNGGLFDGKSYDEPVTMVSLPKGDILSMMTIASLKNILTHEKVEEKPVYLLGLTESDAVLDKIYSKENSLPVGLKLYGPDPQENYVVTGDVTFYAVWSLDRDIEVPVPDPDPDPDPDPNPNPNPNPVPSQPVISTPAHKCPAKEFVDVNINLWYHEALDYVLNEGLMNGVGGKKFDPNGATTRAMIVTILWRQEGEPAVNYNMTFADVAKDTWYTEAVRWAASVGVVEGYSDTAFGPMDKITREQLATILWRYAKYKGCDVSVGENTNILSYDDALDISEWAMPAMQWACGEGVMRGKGGGLLDPSGLATRAEVAQMLLNYFE